MMLVHYNGEKDATEWPDENHYRYTACNSHNNAGFLRAGTPFRLFAHFTLARVLDDFKSP